MAGYDVLSTPKALANSSPGLERSDNPGGGKGEINLAQR